MLEVGRNVLGLARDDRQHPGRRDEGGEDGLTEDAAFVASVR